MWKEISTLKDLYDYCLNQHYKKNDHHPEYFEDPDNEMTRDARIELTCDLLGCVKGVFLKNNLPITVSECRAIIESQNWRHWKRALQNEVPPASATVPTAPVRWQKFPQREKEKLLELFNRLKEKNANETEISKEAAELPSVQYYLKDLHFHRVGVLEVMKELPHFNKPEIEARLHKHDDDKYLPYMVIGYTANWCF